MPRHLSKSHSLALFLAFVISGCCFCFFGIFLMKCIIVWGWSISSTYRVSRTKRVAAWKAQHGRAGFLFFCHRPLSLLFFGFLYSSGGHVESLIGWPGLRMRCQFSEKSPKVHKCPGAFLYSNLLQCRNFT